VLRARRGDIEATAPPDRNDEYLIYQLLVASWPVENLTNEDLTNDYAERLKQALRKCIREAKVHSTWAAPNIEYEEAVLAFVDNALDPRESQAFLGSFLPFQRDIARWGARNSLVQTVLKLTAPGVPDIYQGAELWDLSLVDPDNRRPVDYARRLQLLDEIDKRPPAIGKLMDRWQDGAVKLFVTSRILRFRATWPDLFERGAYVPLLSTGPRAEHIAGFARMEGNRALLVIIARFPARSEANPHWQGTTLAIPPELAGGTFCNLFSGARLSAREVEAELDLVFDGLPVAVFSLEAQ
jgi:(1->4)-alpha-D-glucan 1-alpha-D-glucosylmutase